MKKPEGTALFRQTYLVLVAALILSHLAGFLVIILLPHDDSGVATLSGIATQLADAQCEQPVPEMSRSRRLELSKQQRAPVQTERMERDALLLTQLAQVLGADENALRLFWHHDSDIQLDHAANLSLHNQEGRLQQTLFLRELVFARQWENYWCVGTVPPSPWYHHWQARIALTLLVSLIGLLAMAWLFTRRLSKPMRDFAAAADNIGRDHKAPQLVEHGPQEMRIAARALNAMQLRIQEQLREREALVAAIAHDLRTPLSRIAFRVEAASPVLAESVQRDIEQMNAMISSTLEFAREGQLARGFDRINVEQLLVDMVESERAIGHSVQLKTHPSPIETPLVVAGDELQFVRMFQNLIDNAIKFGESAEISLELVGNDVLINIVDQGPGIAPELIDDMFHPFSRGEPSRNKETGGIGLGLAITRSIARKHDGDLTLRNTGSGLLVSVRLPLHAASG